MDTTLNVRPPRLWRAALALTAGLAVACATLVAVPGAASAAVPTSKPPLLERTSDVVTSDPLPTVQIDSGVVWAQATVGTTVFAGGKFSNAREPLAEPGTKLTPRANLLAYDITTGNLLPWAPTVNGEIKAIAASPDGSRIYIGGSFSLVNGQSRHNLAALDAKTGELVSGFAPSVGGSGVYAIAPTSDSVYVGGLFTQANNVNRYNLAAFDASSGGLWTWVPYTDRQVDSMIIEPGGAHVIVAGRFDHVNGARQRGLVALDPVTAGIDTAWAASKTVKNSTPIDRYKTGYSGIFGLSADANSVYGTGWSMGDTPEVRGNLEGVFAAEVGSGKIRWVADCHGDSYGVYSTGKTVYTTNHTHTCESANVFPEQSPRTWRYFSAFTAEAQGTLAKSQFLSGTYSDWNGTPAPSAYAVTPDFLVGEASGLGQAGFSITGSGEYIAVAGEFIAVNNKRYQGLVRFSTKPAGGAKQGPHRKDTAWGTPTVASDVPVRLTIETNWDRDNRDLTYQLMRSDKTEPVAQTVATSLWWDKGTVSLDDPTAVSGQTYTYTIRAKDADGNIATSAPVSVTATGADPTTYDKLVRRDGAEAYYPLANAKTDYITGATLAFGSGVKPTKNNGGAGPGLTPEASIFDGTVNGRVSSAKAAKGDDNFSAEIWFKTTTTKGGKLFGYGSAQTGVSGTNDRNLYMQNNGRLRFGVSPALDKATVATTTAYNDGKWHHAAVSMTPAGTVIYVDGAVAAKDESMTAVNKSLTGYWRLGYDGNLQAWPTPPASGAFSGSLDEFAAYPSALSAAQVKQHYAAGKGFKAPVLGEITSTPGTDGVVSFATTAKADTGQSISTTAWDFGDGTTATGTTTSKHTYAVSGTYKVTFTATDSRGLTSTKTATVTVTAPNVLPTAGFTAQASDLTVSVDGSASADSDGSVVSYSWNWGDGSAVGSGATAAHTYAAAGTYTVTLTVTDDRGGESAATKDVVVTETPAVARDGFERMGVSGWGTADVGGVWSLAGGSSSAASVSGGVGRLALAAGSTRNMTLGSVSAKNVTLSMDFGVDQGPSTGSAYVGLIARSSASDGYTTRAWLNANGSVSLVVQRGSVVLANSVVSGVTWAAGDVFTLKVDVSGGASTTVSAKLWRQGSAEPSGWQKSVTDANGLDAAGAVGVHANRASSAATALAVTVDNFRVIDNG